MKNCILIFAMMAVAFICNSKEAKDWDHADDFLENFSNEKRAYPPPVVSSVNVYDMCYATVPASSCYRNAPAPGTGCFNRERYTTTSCVAASSDSVVLTMRIFEPVTSDTSKKPVLIYVQGGGYASGNGFLAGGTGLRAWSGTDGNSEICKYFARQGYVVVAVDYRKGWDTKAAKCIGGLPCDNCPCEAAVNNCQSFTFMKANYRMVQDIRAAHRKVLQQRSSLNIDPNEVYYYGNSTGAVGVLHAAYASDDMPSYKKTTLSTSPTLGSELGTVDQYGVSVDMSLFKVAGVYSVAGAIRDVNWIEASDSVRKAVIIFGDEDNAVLPCDGPILNLGYITESAPNFNHLSLIGSVGIHNRFKAITCSTSHDPNCAITMTVRHENVGHALYGDPLKPMRCGVSASTCGSGMSNDLKMFYGIDTFIVGTDMIYDLGYRGAHHIYVNNADKCQKCFYTSPSTLDCSSGTVYRINTHAENEEVLLANEKMNDRNVESIYPNPASGELNVNITDDNISEITFLDISGKIVARFYKPGIGTHSYNIENLSAGIYICNVLTEHSEIRSYKFIKK